VLLLAIRNPQFSIFAFQASPFPRAGQDGDALSRELTACFQPDAFVGAGNQGNFLGAHMTLGRFFLILALKLRVHPQKLLPLVLHSDQASKSLILFLQPRVELAEHAALRADGSSNLDLQVIVTHHPISGNSHALE
jgi:hypothetical protein